MLKRVGSFVPFGAKRLKCDSAEIKTRFYEDGIEISWFANDIIWSKNNCLLHHLTVPYAVTDALICTIDSSRYLAVLFENGLNLFSFSGQTFMIPLPFQISKIFALHKVLLLVRAQSSAFLHPQYADFPVLFTLFHPLEEIRPVAFSDSGIRNAHPRFTTISSPSPRRNGFNFPIPSTPTKANDSTLCFITDNSFDPLHVSNERCYMLARTESSTTFWKFIEPASNRDILLSSPHFIRSPSIFSPPKPLNSMLSPGAVARADIQATLEGIPPDLFIESVLDFSQDAEIGYSSFCEISDGSHKYLVYVHNGALDSLNISYVDNDKPQRWSDDSVFICRYEELMFFVVHSNGSISLFDENRVIAQFDTHDVVRIDRSGRYFILSFADGHKEKFQFSITNDKLVTDILKVVHSTVSSDDYATIVLSLSSSECLSDSNKFFSSFFDLLVNLENEQVISSFFFALHLLFEDLKIHIDSHDQQQKLLPLLIKLAKKLEMVSHLLYYALNTSELISLEENMEFPEFQNPVADIMNYCCECVSGRHIIEFPTPFILSAKVVEVLGQIHKCKNASELVEKTERAKLTLKVVNQLQPAISVALLRAFTLIANSPPENWPIAAYKLIGRDDIAKLIKYTNHPDIETDVKPISLSDLRFLEVERLLQSHIPVTIDVERPNGTDDIVYQSMMVNKLRILLSKQWSLSIGRGIFNLRSLKPMSSQKLVPVELNEKGFHVNGNEIVDTNEAQANSPEYIANRTWSVFHNGVSDGLQVTDASHSWIVDTINSKFTPYTAGILFGFAMNGLLKKLWKIDIFQYLTSPDIKEINAIAMVFGLGISFRGTKDLGISHMLTMHIPELRQSQQSDYEMSCLIKSAAIFGIGFLFEGSGNRHLTETFIKQLEKSAFFEVSALPLAHGAAIGLISLGMGDSSSVLKENREKLCVVFEGSKTQDIFNEKIATFGNSDFFAVAPAAIIALTLGFLRTDHERVKNALLLPEDPAYINKMVPDVILLRTAAALLIDSDPMTAINFTLLEGLNPDVQVSYITGFSIACGIKFAGTMNKKAFERLLSIAKCLALLEKLPFDCTDCSTMLREVCLCTVVLAASYIIAGTCDVTFLRFIREIRRRPCMSAVAQLVAGKQSTLAMAIGVLNLGKGRFTLSQSNSATAALFLAIYPRLARTPGDNEYALQTIRHLINTAAVPRVIELRDVETDEIVNLYITISMANNSSYLIHTPHVLPPFSDISGISIDDEKYYSVHFDKFPYSDENIRPIVWVKKRKPIISHKPCNEENLRAILKMKANPIFEAVTTEEDEIMKVRNELEFDEHAYEIIDFFRCKDISKRLTILYNSSWVKRFLLFFGIPPTARMEDICAADDEALAFLIPHLSPDEVKALI